MFKFDITELTPRFIQEDAEGYALMRAIEGALKYFLARLDEGLANAIDPKSMDEWRLDEMAWELNCLYDYNADVSIKRNWIINAIPYYKNYGTPLALYQYLCSYFNYVVVEENWEYGGEPFHFRVTLGDEINSQIENWIRGAIEMAKNTRSVLDSLRIGAKCQIGITAEAEMLARFDYPMTGTERWAGQWPQENMDGIRGENDIQRARSVDTCAQIVYKMCGADEI